MRYPIGLEVLIEADRRAWEEQRAELKRIARRADIRYKWKLKWGTSRRAFPNLPQEREFYMVRRDAVE